MKKIIFILVIFTLFVGMSFSVKAGFNESVMGWLWGGSEESSDEVINGNETGVGWISMNNLNCDSDGDNVIDVAGCGNLGVSVSTYGVSIPTSDGNVSGYAWSENIGWIHFDDGAPGIAGDEYPFSARRAGDKLVGWARIRSIQSAESAGNSGGWSGWIRLSSDSGDAISYGVVLNSDGTIKPCDAVDRSCAWSDELGWIDFSGAYIRPSLKLCKDDCNSGWNPNTTMEVGADAVSTPPGTQDIVACYSVASSCNDSNPASNVTDDAGTNWPVLDTPDNALSLSGSGDQRTVTADSAGTETIRATHAGETISVDITVQENLCGNEDATDPGEECDDGDAARDGGDGVLNGDCPAACSSVCTINTCSGNWVETAP